MPGYKESSAVWVKQIKIWSLANFIEVLLHLLWAKNLWGRHGLSNTKLCSKKARKRSVGIFGTLIISWRQRDEKDLWWLMSLILKMMKNSETLECPPFWYNFLGFLGSVSLCFLYLMETVKTMAKKDQDDSLFSDATDSCPWRVFKSCFLWPPL